MVIAQWACDETKVGLAGYFLGFMWFQNLMMQREAVGGDWQGTMKEEERAL